MKLTPLIILTPALLAQITNAAVTVVSSQGDGGNNNGSNPIEFTGVSVSTGDIVAIATSVNKNLATTTFSLGTSADSGDISTPSAVTAEETHGAHIHYVTVINPGTYSFTIDPVNANTFTSNSSLYVLRADSGSITVAGTSTQSDTGSPTNTTLDYTFASTISIGDAVSIEALTTQSGAITLDGSYTLAPGGGSSTGTGLGRRVTGFSTAIAGSNWSANHTISPVDDDFVGAGVVFAESIPEPSSTFLLFCSLGFILRRRR